MASKYFEDLKETIEEARKNGAPKEARLVLLGRVLQSGLVFEIIYDEQKTLEDLIGWQEDLSPEEWFQIEEFALFGHDEEYQRDVVGAQTSGRAVPSQ